ncbi:MAG: histone deacetylase family protein [Casimicrobiaceae bacterium]
MDAAYLTHPLARLHEMGPDHPECPERVEAIERGLERAGLLARMTARIAEPLPAMLPTAIRRAHSERLLAMLAATAPEAGYAVIDGDTRMNAHSWPAALAAAGTVVHAVDLVLGGSVNRAFCNVRPPGHHAERDTAMGFCLLNNAAIGVLHAIHQYGLERVALIDFDVHHGNGSEDILTEAMEAGRILMVSTFQHPLYPGSGVRPLASRNCLNVPLAASSDGSALRAVVAEQWLPALEAFRPQLLVISAGFDAHRADPLGGLRWTEEDFRWLTSQLVEVANRHAAGRIISTLEGGYDLTALAASACAHVEALLSSA